MTDKKELRQIVSRMRDSLTPEERAAYSAVIQDRIMGMECYRQAQTVAYFVSFRSEVDTIPLIRHGLAAGKRVLLPVVDRAAHRLLFSELRDFAGELSLSTYGILEPKPEYHRPVAAAEIEFVLTPGLVFDIWGYRIGYGGGFYDRFLSGLERKPRTVAVAYSLQVLDEPLPHEGFDIPVDRIVTEHGVVQCREKRTPHKNGD